METGERRRIAEDWDLSPSHWEYDATGEYLIVEAASEAVYALFSIKLSDESVTPLITSGRNGGVSQIGPNEFAFLRSFMNRPTDLWTFKFDTERNLVVDL